MTLQGTRTEPVTAQYVVNKVQSLIDRYTRHGMRVEINAEEWWVLRMAPEAVRAIEGTGGRAYSATTRSDAFPHLLGLPVLPVEGMRVSRPTLTVHRRRYPFNRATDYQNMLGARLGDYSQEDVVIALMRAALMVAGGGTINRLANGCLTVHSGNRGDAIVRRLSAHFGRTGANTLCGMEVCCTPGTFEEPFLYMPGGLFPAIEETRGDYRPILVAPSAADVAAGYTAPQVAVGGVTIRGDLRDTDQFAALVREGNRQAEAFGLNLSSPSFHPPVLFFLAGGEACRVIEAALPVGMPLRFAYGLPVLPGGDMLAPMEVRLCVSASDVYRYPQQAAGARAEVPQPRRRVRKVVAGEGA